MPVLFLPTHHLFIIVSQWLLVHFGQILLAQLVSANLYAPKTAPEVNHVLSSKTKSSSLQLIHAKSFWPITM